MNICIIEYMYIMSIVVEMCIHVHVHNSGIHVHLEVEGKECVGAVI